MRPTGESLLVPAPRWRRCANLYGRDLATCNLQGYKVAHIHSSSSSSPPGMIFNNFDDCKRWCRRYNASDSSGRRGLVPSTHISKIYDALGLGLNCENGVYTIHSLAPDGAAAGASSFDKLPWQPLAISPRSPLECPLATATLQHGGLQGCGGGLQVCGDVRGHAGTRVEFHVPFDARGGASLGVERG